MKKIFSIIMAFTASALMFTSCSTDNEATESISENDYPVILNSDFPNRDGNNPGLYKTITVGDELSCSVLYSPTKYSTVTWLIDGVQIAEGSELKYSGLLAGDYVMVVKVTTTQKKETSRTVLIRVLPLDGDPVASTDAAERMVAPGKEAVLHGTNLSSIKKIEFGSTVVDNVEFVSSMDGNYIKYTVPQLEPGVYRIVLVDADGNRYGGGQVTVSSAALVNKNSFSGKGGASVTMNGINLDDVKTIAINGKEATITEKAFGSLTFTVPVGLEEGTYSLTATSTSGQTVTFVSETGISESCSFTITSEVTVWEGSWVVDWGSPFTELKTTMRSKLSVGCIIRLYVSGNGQGAATTAWWNNFITCLDGEPNRGDITINGTQVLTYGPLEQKSLDKISSEDGFYVVGTGYTLTKITIE